MVLNVNESPTNTLFSLRAIRLLVCVVASLRTSSPLCAAGTSVSSARPSHHGAGYAQTMQELQQA